MILDVPDDADPRYPNCGGYAGSVSRDHPSVTYGRHECHISRAVFITTVLNAMEGMKYANGQI